VILNGPYPLDLRVPKAGASAALTSLRQGRAADLPASGATQPGLYLVLQEGTLAGFWIVLDESWLLHGTVGPPDRFPPLAGALLGAATEAVWWRGLPVRRTGRRWNPMIVLEWPPALADRSTMAPPGSPILEAEVYEEDEGDGWFEPTRTAGAPEAARVPSPALAPRSVSPPCSLITVIAGRLEFQRAVHRGTWQLVQPEAPSPDDSTPLEMDAWLREPKTGRRADPLPAAHTLGPELLGPGGRRLRTMNGWLTRGLEIWPARPADVEPGLLADRDIESPWRRQAVHAVTFACASLLPVVLLALIVRIISAPELSTAAPTPTVEAQPAISVCSADHETFVTELRCQIALASGGLELPPPGCGDAEAVEAPERKRSEDLQATFCGLYDRARDGALMHVELEQGLAIEMRSADYAAAEACFNVLGRPDPYLLRVKGGRVIADPERFFNNDALRFRPLEDVMTTLAQRCDEVRPQMEERVAGATFATHVGTSAEPPAAGGLLRKALQQLAAPRAGSTALVDCFEAGATAGVEVDVLRTMCGPDHEGARPTKNDIWGALAGRPRGSAINRYAEARFAGGSSADALWTCHRTLIGELVPDLSSPSTAPWGLPVPLHTSYDVLAGGVETQLQLDAVVRAGAAEGAAGGCWQVVMNRLEGYEPVHPLLTELDPTTWPSVDQQLCGQVCAARFQVATSPHDGAWITPAADLARCVDPTAGAAGAGGMGGTLDRLYLPWNDFPRVPRDAATRASRVDVNGAPGDAEGTTSLGCTSPRKPATAAEVCAFNLVAQGAFSHLDVDLLQGGLTGATWAGELSGRPLAGSLDGQAVLSAQALGTYGGTRSLRSCSAVATQCFTATMLEVIQDPDLRRQQWLDAWQERVVRPGAEQGESCAAERTESPWCELVRPYLSVDGILPEGQFDYPCAKGVEDARMATEEALRALATNLQVAREDTP
jgi:hypothetical protein